ncbi:hypothetical protein ANCCAN_17700 [Ancylostoma caninum]|uniref:Uncharacterized protein n=1 Tax=Ancylostoma caninum TaxID=29170 RepID=A0A368FW47_ANCCA|nr:hypothetical protein ANCCAN_17700 [Ancylostoma caninum]
MHRLHSDFTSLKNNHSEDTNVKDWLEDDRAELKSFYMEMEPRRKIREYARQHCSSILQAQHTWDLFKLHNVHILAEISVPRPGFIFQTISDTGKHLVDLLLLPDHKVSLTLPLKSGWTRRYTFALPTNQQKFVTLVTLEGKHVSVVVNCVQLLLENIDDVAFT